MSIQNFSKKYKSSGEPIHKINKKWLVEKSARDFLGTPVFGSVVLGDLVTGENIFDIDKVPDEIFEAMKQIFPNKVESVEDAAAFLAEKTLNGDASVRGTINAIQGRLGEFQFQSNFGNYAELAGDPTQQHYDVKVTLPDGPTNYVQVKVYKDPGDAFNELEKLNEALLKGEIVDGADQVSRFSFAVNDELVEELTAKAAEINSNITVLPIGASYDDIRSSAASAVVDHETYLDDFFEGLLGGLVVGAALHAGVNGFLVYRGHKAISDALEDTAYSTAVTGGVVAASLGVEFVGAELIGLEVLGLAAGPVGFCVMLGVGISARAVLSRVANRRYYSRRVSEGNTNLFELCEGLAKVS